MAKALTTILYASSSALAVLAAEVAEARNAGQPIRLIALEEFRGETEQNAGAVYVQAPEGFTDSDDASDSFAVLLDSIRQAYPHLEVQQYKGPFKPFEPEVHKPEMADAVLRDLRLQLIGLGGSAPANANAEELANLIAAQQVNVDLAARKPVMPTPATQGTVIPDATPVVQKVGADKLVSPAAVGTSPEALKMAEDEAGAGSGDENPGEASPVQTAELADLDKVTTHKQADDAAKAENVDLTGKSTVADKVAAIREARG